MNETFMAMIVVLRYSCVCGSDSTPQHTRTGVMASKADVAFPSREEHLKIALDRGDQPYGKHAGTKQAAGKYAENRDSSRDRRTPRRHS